MLIFVCSRAAIRALPGDPMQTLMAETGTRFSSQEIEDSLHLKELFWKATLEDLNNVLHLRWGNSLLSQQPIGPLLKKRTCATLELSLVSVILALLISIPLGLAAAARPHSFWDRFCSFYSGWFSSFPLPWLGPLFILIGAVWLHIFPVDRDLALPSICLALSISSFWVRLIRSRVREVLLFGAAPGARARGIPEWKILFKYGLGPASGALIAYLGTQFGMLLGGAIVTETIFNWPGLGSLLVDSVLKRDYPLVEAAIFVAAAMCLLFTRLGEFLQSKTDPRDPRGFGAR